MECVSTVTIPGATFTLGALRARLQDEHRRHADEVERLKTEMAAVEAMQGLAM